MKTRLMVCAFLRHGDELLFLHRGLHKTIAPGMWSGVGGHMENAELNEPEAACLREIKEETGIDASMIRSLELRYITVRNKGKEVSQIYHFVGSLAERVELPYCDEGTLHWRKLDEIPSLEMTFSVKQVMLHWLAHQEEDAIFLCGVHHGSDAVTSWVKL